MSTLLPTLTAVAGTSPFDYVTPWHDLNKEFWSSVNAVNHAAWLAAIIIKALWVVFLIPCLIAFIDALRRPEYLYPNSKGYSKTLWVIAIAAGFVFTVGWLVVPLYLFLVVLPARRNMETSSAAPALPTTEAPSRPFKDPPA